MRLLLFTLLAAIQQCQLSLAQPTVPDSLSACTPDIDILKGTLYGCSIGHMTTMIDCLKTKANDITNPLCLDAVNAYVAQHSSIELGDLQGCAADVDVPTQTLYGCSITNLPALSACLQSKTDQITDNDCIDALGTYIADHDSEGAHRPVETDDERDAEDQICDAKFAAVCQRQFYIASITQQLGPLKRCAIQHINETGHTCVAMLQNATTDGLLALEFCPAATALVATQAMLGLKSLQVGLIGCLKNHTDEMKQGCSGFFESVSDVVKQIGDRASNQFHQDEDTIPGVPTPTQPPNVPSGVNPTQPPNVPGKTPTPDQPTDTHPGSGKTDTSNPDTHGGDDNSGLSGGAIAGIVVSCLVVVAAAGAGVWYWRKRVAYANLNSMMGLAQGNALPQMEVGFEAGGKSEYERVMMA